MIAGRSNGGAALAVILFFCFPCHYELCSALRSRLATGTVPHKRQSTFIAFFFLYVLRCASGETLSVLLAWTFKSNAQSNARVGVPRK